MAKFEEKAVLLRVISEYDPLAGRLRHVRALPNSFLSNLYRALGHLYCGVGGFEAPCLPCCRFLARAIVARCTGSFSGVLGRSGGSLGAESYFRL